MVAIGVTASAAASAASAATATAPVTQDGFIGAQSGANSVVLGGGTGPRLSLATPSPSSAAQYTRKAYFGFDLSAIKALGAISIDSATATFTLSSNVATAYNGLNAVRFYAVTDGSDTFSETTLTWANAPGNSSGDVLAAQRTAGTVLGDVAVTNPAANGVLTLTGAALATAIQGDTNNFLTIAVDYRGSSNTGYGLTDGSNATGLGFVSKETAAGAGAASLAVNYSVPEPGGVAAGGAAVAGLLARRRRRLFGL